MSFSRHFDHLVDALTCLPGVGPKSAQRMALHLLLKKPQAASTLSSAIGVALDKVQNCRPCRNLSDDDVCLICANPLRDHSIVCVVEAPADVLAFEQSTDYQGVYFVLMGHIAPLDGIGPAELGLDVLDERLAQGEIRELVLPVAGVQNPQSLSSGCIKSIFIVIFYRAKRFCVVKKYYK